MREAGFVDGIRELNGAESLSNTEIETGERDDLESPLMLTRTDVTSDIVRCVLTAGLYPQILRARRFSDKRTASRRGKGREDQLPIHLLQADNKEVLWIQSTFVK